MDEGTRVDDSRSLDKKCCIRAYTYFLQKKLDEGNSVHDVLELGLFDQEYHEHFYDVLDEMASKGIYVQDIIDYNLEKDKKELEAQNK